MLQNHFNLCISQNRSNEMNIVDKFQHKNQNGRNDQFMIFVRNFADVKRCIFSDLNNFSLKNCINKSFRCKIIPFPLL